jgi:hypothetical protein
VIWRGLISQSVWLLGQQSSTLLYNEFSQHLPQCFLEDWTKPRNGVFSAYNLVTLWEWTFESDTCISCVQLRIKTLKRHSSHIYLKNKLGWMTSLHNQKIQVTTTVTISDLTQKWQSSKGRERARRKGKCNMTLPWDFTLQTTSQYISLGENHWKNWGAGRCVQMAPTNISHIHPHTSFGNFIAKAFVTQCYSQLCLTFNAYLEVPSDDN